MFLFPRLKSLRYTVTQCALAWCVILLLFFFLLQRPSGIGLAWFFPTVCVFLYCYLAVLFSLKQPGPGERQGEERGRGHRMKRKAINIILVNMVSYVVNYLPPLMIYYLASLVTVPIVASDVAASLGIVCGLVQPFLYLHRAGKLPCLERERERERERALTWKLKGDSANFTN